MSAGSLAWAALSLLLSILTSNPACADSNAPPNALSAGSEIAAASGGMLKPQLDRIRIITISSTHPRQSAQRYAELFAYQPVEQGWIAKTLATRWGAPAAADREYVLLQAPGDELAYLRFVQVNTPAEYRPLTTRGWNALELLVRDPYEIDALLQTARDFARLGGPAPLTADSSIHAVQYLGPDREVIYLTADLGDAASSTLARASTKVGRPFIVVLAGPTLDTLAGFYRQTFGLSEAFRVAIPIPLIAHAQGLPQTHQYPLSLLRLNAFSHSIELDAYPSAPARPALAGELPPGIAMVSFCQSDPLRKDASVVRSNAAPDASSLGRAYAGRLPAVFRGAADEIIEVLDCDPDLASH